jgi:hypothetical protein
MAAAAALFLVALALPSVGVVGLGSSRRHSRSGFRAQSPAAMTTDEGGDARAV